MKMVLPEVSGALPRRGGSGRLPVGAGRRESKPGEPRR